MPDRYAIIIGSGFGDWGSEGSAHELDTRFGPPSAPLRETTIAAEPVYTLARHGPGHSLPPHAINYRANIAALKSLDVTAIIALNTVGGIGEAGDTRLAVPDQLLDYTWGRAHTFFDGSDGVVEHIDFTAPFAAGLRRHLVAAARAAGVSCRDGGTYAATQGPRLETAAEIDRYERDGADYVGMTGMPEAALAAEAGMDYACLALVVNRAAGRGELPIHEDLEANSAAARSASLEVLEAFFRNNGSGGR